MEHPRCSLQRLPHNLDSCLRISEILKEIEGGVLGQESKAKEDECFVAGIYTSFIACHVNAGDLGQAEAGLRRALQHGMHATNAMHASIMFGWAFAANFIPTYLAFEWCVLWSRCSPFQTL